MLKIGVSQFQNGEKTVSCRWWFQMFFLPTAYERFVINADFDVEVWSYDGTAIESFLELMFEDRMDASAALYAEVKARILHALESAAENAAHKMRVLFEAERQERADKLHAEQPPCPKSAYLVFYEAS